MDNHYFDNLAGSSTQFTFSSMDNHYFDNFAGSSTQFTFSSMDNHYFDNLAGSSTHEPSLPDQQIINQLAFSSTTAQFSTPGGGEISAQDMMHMEQDHLLLSRDCKPKSKRRYLYYSVEDVKELIQGVCEHGKRWEKILQESQRFQIAGRTAENLLDKWRDMLKVADSPKDHKLKELCILAKAIDETVRKRN